MDSSHHHKYMKTEFFIAIALGSLGLAACRERIPKGDQSASSNAKTTEASARVRSPVQSVDPNFEQKAKNAVPIDKSEDRDVEDIQIRQKDEDRIEVFAVPLSDSASRDRDKAWNKLATIKSSVPLSGEQVVYASDLIDQYKNSSQIEKLVIWRLVYLRMYEQGASSTSLILDDYQSLRLDMPLKLNRLLYSALDLEPASLEIYQAAKKGKEILRMSADNPSK